MIINPFKWYGLDYPKGVSMARPGKRVKFHGAFADKRQAVKKEKSVGGFIERKTINGHVRYVVMTAR